MQKSLFVLVLALVAAPLAAAAFPQTLRLQGALRNLAGEPATDGAYGATFVVYDGPGAGAAKLYSEAHPAVSVNNGVFTVVLGSVDAAVNPLPDVIFVQHDALFLGVTVGEEPELARTPLQAVPWAFRAKTADSTSALQCTGCVSGAHLAPAVLDGYVKTADLSAYVTVEDFQKLAVPKVQTVQGTLAPGESLTLSHGAGSFAASAVGYLKQEGAWVALAGAQVQAGVGSDPAHDVHWSFDACDAADQTDEQNDGKFVGNITCVDGKFGKALSFPGGSNTHVRLDVTAKLAKISSQHTFAMWLRYKPGDTTNAPFSYDDGGNKHLWNHNDGAMTMHWSGGSNLSGVLTIPKDAWAHVATTYDGSTWRAYLNGVETGSVANQPNLPLGAGNCILLGEDADGNCAGGGDTDVFAGLIDELHVYTRALSAAEIAELVATNGADKALGGRIVLTDENTASLTNNSLEAGDYRLVVVTP